MAEKTVDRAAKVMLKRAKELKIQTAFDRFELQLPQCTVGLQGICCRICVMGPCRITKKVDRGVCGATADTIVARNWVRAVAGGTACHTDHARHVAITLLKATKGTAPYEIKGVNKLKELAEKLRIEGSDTNELARKVAMAALEDFSRQTDEPLTWLQIDAPKERIDVWGKLGILPANSDRTICEAMHRTHMGMDSDPINLILGAVKLGLVDGYAGLFMATDLQDVLFGVPQPVATYANLGVLKKAAVNLAVHGHIPLLSEKIVEAAKKLEKEAVAAGAKEGINVVGICCTGNEVLTRHGIPIATNMLTQELAIITGALDAMVGDVQCLMPSLTYVAECFHTKVITTFPIAKIPGAQHVEFTEENADKAADEIVRIAIQAFKNRVPEQVMIPDEKVDMMAGFSVEAIVSALSKINKEDPLKPLVDNIANGNILGAVGMIGCDNPKVPHDKLHTELAAELIKNNVLVVTCGCSAQALAKAGFLSPNAADRAGDGLKGVLKAIGGAVGIKALPPCLHMGACVDNSRIGALLAALANKLGVAIKDLPVAGSAPEFMSEKAMAIGNWYVAQGVLVHLGVEPPVLGSATVTKVLTQDAEKLFGSKVVVEKDPKAAAKLIIEHIKAKRKALGI
jgi:carbon-monoxide dehydrogenase catalytic subunit